MHEKRISNRIEVQLKALLHEVPGEGSHSRVVNLSKGGLFLISSRRLKIGTDVTVDIDAENIGRVIWASGHVVRVTETGMAIEFTNSDECGLDMLLRVESFMASKIKKIKNSVQSGITRERSTRYLAVGF